MSDKEILKRELFNKFENTIKKIKSKISNNLTEEEKNKLLKKIVLVIVLFQVDSLYKKLSDVSGLSSIFQLFGLNEKNGNKLRNIGEGSSNILTLALLIFKYLKREVK